MADNDDLNEEELRIMRGSRKLLDDLLKNPKTKLEAERLIKTLHPETVTTADINAPVMEELQALRKQFKEHLDKLESGRIDGELNSQFAQLRSTGYTDEGIEKIKEIMVQRGIPNPTDAAVVWEKQNPPESPPPSGFQPGGWGKGFGIAEKKEDIARMITDTDDYFDEIARDVWNEEARKNQVR
jgi:hypothetical protein